MSASNNSITRPAPSPEGAYADDLSIQAYQNVLHTLRQQHIVLELNSMNGQDTSRQYAMHRLKDMIKYLDTILKNECRHEYVTSDYIDITPDKGQNITYCETCFSTFA